MIKCFKCRKTERLFEGDLTADTALRLGRFFGTSPELWLNLQKTYELDKAKTELGKKIQKINPWKPQEEVYL